jgi:predicted metallopeptidase
LQNVPPTRQQRPQLGPALRRLIRDVARKLPELAHVRASRVLVVSGEARRASRATIRPLASRLPKSSTRRRPVVRFQGRRVLYVITLRPAFFRRSSAHERVATLLHELYHISTRFDGTLHRGRRHAMLPGRRFQANLAPLVKRYLAVADAELIAALDYHGEVLVRQWLEKPPLSIQKSSRVRRRYDEAQLFLGPVMMVSRSRRLH